jgi:DNA-binding PadR family transcriptional regulator
MIKIAREFLAHPHGQHYGFELTRSAHVFGGTLYPLLGRWLAAGWLTDGWEDPAVTVGRPPRRYYQLTDSGRAALTAMITERTKR